VSVVSLIMSLLITHGYDCSVGDRLLTSSVSDRLQSCLVTFRCVRPVPSTHDLLAMLGLATRPDVLRVEVKGNDDRLG
jgi:hypothetical protein